MDLRAEKDNNRVKAKTAFPGQPISSPGLSCAHGRHRLSPPIKTRTLERRASQRKVSW